MSWVLFEEANRSTVMFSFIWYNTSWIICFAKICYLTNSFIFVRLFEASCTVFIVPQQHDKVFSTVVFIAELCNRNDIVKMGRKRLMNSITLDFIWWFELFWNFTGRNTSKNKISNKINWYWVQIRLNETQINQTKESNRSHMKISLDNFFIANFLSHFSFKLTRTESNKCRVTFIKSVDRFDE